MGQATDAVRAALERGQQVLEQPGQLMEEGQNAAQSLSDMGDRINNVRAAVSQESSTLGKVRAAIGALGGEGEGVGEEQKQRLIIQEAIDVGAPRAFVFAQWREFEDFAEKSRALQRVEIEDGEDGEEGEDGEPSSEWQAKILFSTRQWTSEITDEIEGHRIAWNSSGDVNHAGAVSFHELAETLTRVHVEMEYRPTGFVEKFGNLFLTVRHRVRKDLRLFKHHVELQDWPESDEAEERRSGSSTADARSTEKVESSDGRGAARSQVRKKSSTRAGSKGPAAGKVARKGARRSRPGTTAGT
jgi:uncharacterized membrane protein